MNKTDYTIDPKYACTYYNLPSREICALQYPPVTYIPKNFNYYWGYFATIIMLMQNPRIARIVLRYWGPIIIITNAIYYLQV